MKRLIIPILFLACNSHAAGIQKWVDENGQVHYGDSPPARVSTEAVRVSRPPTNPGKTLPRLNTDSKKADENTPAESSPDQVNAPPTEPTQDEAKEFCARAKKDLLTLNKSNRLRLKLADGTTRYMTQEEVAARRKQSEEDIKSYCK